MRYTITTPKREFAGEVAGVSFQRGTGTLDGGAEGAVAALGYFQRAGYGITPDEPAEATVEAPAAPVVPPEDEPFDPAKHNMDEVLAYLNAADTDADEASRVLDAEILGKDRSTITKQRGAILAAKTSSDPSTAPAADDQKGPTA